MKLPRRLSEILSRKQAYIDSQRDKLEKSVIKMQSELFSEMINEMIPSLDIKNGVIQNTANNYRLISAMDRTYKNFQSSAGQSMLNLISNATTKIGTLSAEYFTLVTTVPDTFEKIVAKADKLINLRLGLNEGKLVRGGFLQSYFEAANLGTDLKQMTSKAVSGGMDMKVYSNALKDMITGSPDYKGGLEKQFDRYAFDLYQQYDRAYNTTIGNELGFTYFIYQNGLVADSRDFCVAHDGKVWSIEESKSWKDWTPSKGEYPAGYEVKAKDINAVPSYLNYAGYDPLIDLGGYNCRHCLGWLPDDMAFDMRPELKNEN
jgi:hypothetical protein